MYFAKKKRCVSRYFRFRSWHAIRCPRDFSPPLDLAPGGEIPSDFALPRGQIPGNLALPARPPFGSPPPLPQKSSYSRGYSCILDAATKCVSEILFGNLFDKRFAGVRANLDWYFKKLELTFDSSVYVITVLQLRAWFCCLLKYILPYLVIVSWVNNTSIMLIYSLSCQLMKAYFTFE